MSTLAHAVGVVIWTTQEYGRRVLSGVIEHYRETNGVEVLALSADQNKRSSLCRELDGIIAPLERREVHRWRSSFHGPLVAVPLIERISDITCVSINQASVATEAVQHFAAMRLPHAVMYADPLDGGLTECREIFNNTAAAAGLHVTAAPRLNRRDEQTIIAWLKKLPLPTGVFACSDNWARRIIRCAKQAGLRIPKDLAVLGLGNAPITCRTGGVGLSSMAVPAEALGRRAAEVLDALRAGESQENISLQPNSIVTRASTEVVCVSDPLVAEVTRQIRARFLENPGTEMLAQEQGIARRTLDQRFRAYMGCSIHDEMVRCRLQWATGMLADEGLAVKIIAERLGMQMSNFSRFIREHTGFTPREYRQRCLHEGL